MDTILTGIIASQHPEVLKKQLITKVALNASKPQPVRVIQSVLQITSKWYLDGESAFAVSEGLSVYKAWAKYNLTTFESFFDREFLLSLLALKGKNAANAMTLIQDSMELLQRSSCFLGHAKVIEAKAISYVREHPSLDCLTNFVKFLDLNKECLPKGDFTITFCVSLIQSLSFCTIPQDEKDIVQYIKNVDTVCSFVHYIWNTTDSDIILQSLKAIFRIISAIEDTEPSFCLGGIVQNIPEKTIETVVNFAVSSDIDNTHMTTALQRVVDWLQWPTSRNISLWIITFFKSLAAAKKYSVLMKVTETKVEQVCQKMEYPAVREGALSVLTHMLMGFQHSPEPFHMILQHIPSLIQSWKQENSAASQSLLQKLSDLLHCSFFLHAGYPDLYDPILESLKGLAIPTAEEIKAKLQESQWLAQKTKGSNYVSKVTQRSETGKTGLFNLGNTCYINSVIQALFMCDKRDVLQDKPSVDQKIIGQLQHVFAFLSQTQRPAYAPMTFNRLTRPVWFTAGHQQDCSEYLKYLLDQLHEQEVTRLKKEKLKQEPEQDEGTNNMNTQADEKTVKLPPSLIEQNFGGQVVTTVTCLNCQNESPRTEMFTDIHLAFPEYKPITEESVKGDNKNDSDCNGSKVTKLLHLNDLLQFYLTPEKLMGDNKYYCDKCDSLQDAERKIKITEPPQNLIITLMRFSYDVKLHTRSKIFREVKYPRTLILPRKQSVETEIQNHNQRRSLRSAVTRQIEKCGVDLNTRKGEVYGLNAVVVHSGTSSESGHYYTYARHSIYRDPEKVFESFEDCVDEDDIDFLQDKWYLFNDNRVSYAQYSSFSNVTQRFTKDTAYVLFYKRIDPLQSEKAEVDLNKSIHIAEVDPPLQDNLRQAVSKDNALYLQEQEISERKKASRKRTSSTNTSSLFYKSDDEDGPPGSCGGSSGLNHNGPRFVF